MQKLTLPTAPHSLAAFRILFGFIMAYDAWRYTSRGWIDRNFVDLDFHFTYLDFLPVLPAGGIEAMSWAWGLGGLLICLGLFYRFGCLLFLIGFGYLFLLEKSNYLNHFYFALLLGFCLLLVPANRVWSLDRMFGLLRGQGPAVPNWSYVLLKGQIEIMLIWAGIVKINADWLSGYPLNEWLPQGVVDMPRPLVPYVTDPDWVIPAAWGSVVLHLVAAPLLLFPRTRLAAFIVYCGFHLMNHWLWNIGIFPWLAMAGGLIFFAPDWPQRLWARLRQLPMPVVRGYGTPNNQPLMTGLVLGWLVVQALIPLRPLLFAGDVTWTEEGHRFSWRMKLRDKDADVDFYLLDPTTGNRTWVDQSYYLTRRQSRKMASRPDMIIQFAHHVRDVFHARTGRMPQIYAVSSVSLNGRPPRPMIDPNADLAQEQWHPFSRDRWITDFVENRPLERSQETH